MEETDKILQSTNEEIRRLKQQIDLLELATAKDNSRTESTNVQVAAQNNTPLAYTHDKDFSRVNALLSTTPRLQLRAPPFTPGQPDIWFAILENIFEQQHITEDCEKFTFAISNLDQRATAIVSDVILHPPLQQAYVTLKTSLIARCTKLPEQRISQVMYQEKRGERCPSDFWRHLRALVDASIISNKLLLHVWQQQLPQQVQLTLMAYEGQSVETLLQIADRACATLQSSMIASVTSAVTSTTEAEHDSSELSGESMLSCAATSYKQKPNIAEGIKQLQATMEKMATRLTNLELQTSTSNKAHSHSKQDQDQAKDFCWYHRRFGPRATRCTKPCGYPNGDGSPL